MDLNKIGKYIAAKRKDLGLTQKQLAEKLNMSDKSVSKWERGVCLPDVSVYLELCEILGISINEFLAGEDISQENMVKQSEDNIIEVTKHSNHRIRNLKGKMAVLSVALVIAVSILGVMAVQYLIQPKNYIMPVSENSVEMKTARLLSGIDGAYLFDFSSKDSFRELKIYMSEYRFGELMKKEEIGSLNYEDESLTKGKIVIVPHFYNKSFQLVVADEWSKFSTTVPFLEDVESEENIRSSSGIDERTKIQYDSEIGLWAISWGKDYVESMSVIDFEEGLISDQNEYTYYISVVFEK